MKTKFIYFDENIFLIFGSPIAIIIEESKEISFIFRIVYQIHGVQKRTLDSHSFY